MRLTPPARLWIAVFALVLAAGQAAVGMRASRTASVTGDEPFYLVTAQSLVSDGDLDLRDEYANAGVEMARFWDGTKPLWKQMQPAPDGRLLAPHDPGLPLVIAPAYAVGGLGGVQRFLVVLWAAAMACAALLAARAGAPAWVAGLGAIAVGAGAPGIVYASQVYPEGPAALAVAAALLLAGGRKARPVVLALVLVALVWLGVKYAPMAVLIAGLWAWRFRDQRWSLVAAGAIAVAAGVHFVWWHVDTFGGLTPYSTNVVWAGEGTASILASHVDVGDRLYRLHGLFLDARFGLIRWLPITALALVAGLTRATARHAAIVGTCVLMGTFASITIMGWWFPGRMLVAGFPALVVLVAVAASRLPRTAAALTAWSVAIGATVAWGAHHRWIRLAVDPFDLGVPLGPAGLFPDFRHIGVREVLLTSVWFAAAAGLGLLLRWRRSCSSTATPSRTERSSRSRPHWRPLPGR